MKVFGFVFGLAMGMLISVSPAAAQLIESSDVKAVQTQITDPSQRPKDTTEHVKSLLGDTPHNEDVYRLAAEIVPILVEQSGNNLAVLSEMLDRAGKNPEAFFKTLPADKQQAIRDIASKIEKSKAPQTPR